MPTYTYCCAGCGHTFERVLKIADRGQPISESCPECNSEGTVVRSITPVQFSMNSYPKKVSDDWTNLMQKKKRDNSSRSNPSTINDSGGLR